MLRRLLLLGVLSATGCGEVVIPDAVCSEQPFRGGLHVDAGDPRKVWATDYATEEDIAVQPRPPLRFTFKPNDPTVLFDGNGQVLSRDGEITQSGCFDATSRTLYIGPADVPDPNRPPN